MANQTQNFTALLSNFDTAIDATNTAMNSFGSANRENARAMESILGRVGRLKSEFENLATNVIDNQVVKSLLKLATEVLGTLNTGLGQTLIQIGLLSSIGWGTTQLMGALRIFSVVGNQFKTLGLFLKELPVAFKLASEGAGTLAEALSVTTVAAQGLRSIALPIISIISTLAVLIIPLFDKLNVTLEEQKEKVENLQGELGSLKTEYQQLLSKGDLTENEQNRLALLKAEIELNKVLLEQEAKKSYEKEFGAKSGVYDTSYDPYHTAHNISGLEAAQNTLSSYNYYSDRITENEAQFTKLGENAEANAKVMQRLDEQIQRDKETQQQYKEQLLATARSLLDYKDAIGELSPEAQTFLDELLKIAEVTHDAVQATDEATGSFKELATNLKNDFDGLQAAHDTLNEVVETYNTTGAITAEQLTKLVELGTEYTDLLSLENGQLVLNKEALYSKAEEVRANYVEQLKNAAAEELYNIAVGGTSEAIENVSTAAKNSTDNLSNYSLVVDRVGASALSAASGVSIFNASLGGTLSDEQQKQMEQVLKNLQDQIKAFNSVSLMFAGVAHGGSATSGSPALKSFQSAYGTLKHQKEMGLLSEEQYYNSLEKLMENYTKDAIAHMKQYKLSYDQIQESMFQYEKELYEGRKKLVKSLAQARRNEFD